VTGVSRLPGRLSYGRSAGSSRASGGPAHPSVKGNSMFDISKTAVEETGILELNDANDAPSHRRRRQAVLDHRLRPWLGSLREARGAKRQNRLVDRLKRKGKADMSPEEQRAEQAEFLAAITVSFNHFGYPPAGDARARTCSARSTRTASSVSSPTRCNASSATGEILRRARRRAQARRPGPRLAQRNSRRRQQTLADGRRERVSRREELLAAGEEIDLPECGAPFLVARLLEIGP
jgi:hypothetical protein